MVPPCHDKAKKGEGVLDQACEHRGNDPLVNEFLLLEGQRILEVQPPVEGAHKELQGKRDAQGQLQWMPCNSREGEVQQEENEGDGREAGDPVCCVAEFPEKHLVCLVCDRLWETVVG